MLMNRIILGATRRKVKITRMINVQYRTFFTQQKPLSKRTRNLYQISQRRAFIPPQMWRLLWPIIQPLVRPLIGVAIAFVTSFFTAWANERKVQQARRFIESAPGAAAAAEGAPPPNTLTPILARVFLISIICSVLYGTRLRNPLYEAVVGPEQVALEYAENRAKLPLTYYWDSKTAMSTMDSRLNSMESSLGAALANSPTPEKLAKVEKIREKGYSNGIMTSLGRAQHFAREGAVGGMEKCINKVDVYRRKGGKVQESKIDEVVNLGLKTRINILFIEAQQSANKGAVSKMLSSISEIRTLQGKLRNTTSSISESEIDQVAQRGHTFRINTLLDEAQKVRESGSRRQTELKLEEARRYAMANQVDFDDNVAQEIINGERNVSLLI